MIDEIRVGFSALRARGVPAQGALGILPIDSVEGVLLGIDAERRPHVLLPLEDDQMVADLPAGIATLDFASRPLVLEGRTRAFLDVTCLFESVAEVFEHFTVAVLDRIARQGIPPPQALVSVLERWRQFLTPTQGAPSREKLASVLGELLVLADLVDADPARRVDAWVGPFGARHDIRRSDIAIEVKTSRSHTARTVRVHGEDQLEAPVGGTLHLHFVRVEDVPGGGVSVSGVVDGLLAKGVRAEALFTALSAAAIPVTELTATADVPFEIRERRTFVVGDAMPRIVPATFVAGNRPVGVSDVDYTIDLDVVWDEALSEVSYNALVAELAVADA